MAADYSTIESNDAAAAACSSILRLAQVNELQPENTDTPLLPDTTLVLLESPRNNNPNRLGSGISPSGALYRSLTVPGWGQWENGRREKAALFAIAETIFIGGFLYEQIRLSGDTISGPEKDAARTDRNTFLLYWMAAKVLDIMDAYVDAQFRAYDVSDITPDELAR